MIVFDGNTIYVDRGIRKIYRKRCGDGILSYSVLPHSIPWTIQFGQNTTDHRYVVRFRYFGFERSEEVLTERGIIVQVQEWARIVNRIEIPDHLVHPEPAASCSMPDLFERLIGEAMVEMSRRTDYENSNTCVEYFELIQDIIHKYKDELFASVPAVA